MEYNWARGLSSAGDKYIDMLHVDRFIVLWADSEASPCGVDHDPADGYHNSRSIRMLHA